MAGDIDRVSQAIGKLEAHAENQARATSRIFEKLEEISGAVQGVSAVTERVDRLEPLVDRHERDRNAGRGLLVGLSVGGGAAGGGIVVTLLRKLGLAP